MSDCDHGWSDPAHCWECEEQREEDAAFAALPWRVRVWRRAKRTVLYSRPGWAVRSSWWAVKRWLRSRGVLKAPTPVNFTAFDDLLKEHYSAGAVRPLAYAESPFLRMPPAPKFERASLTRPVFQGVAKLPPDDEEQS